MTRSSSKRCKRKANATRKEAQEKPKPQQKKQKAKTILHPLVSDPRSKRKPMQVQAGKPMLPTPYVQL